MRVREIVPEDWTEWLRMREALWPGSLSDHDVETRRYFEQADDNLVTLVAEESDGTLVGFLELDRRRYAPGCEESPVPFIEGWYVNRHARGRGVGRALVRAAEEWALAHGYGEMASDVEIDNADGIAAHLALGFHEVERVVCFRRSLRDASVVRPPQPSR
jgi:aminoglycoside 6'-N-acetyltransferase I